MRGGVTHGPAHFKSTQSIHYGENQILVPEARGMCVVQYASIIRTCVYLNTSVCVCVCVCEDE